MMRRFFHNPFLVVSLCSLLFSVALAANWEVYRSDDYGFQMLVPEGTRFEESDYGDGWGGLIAEVDDATALYAVGRLGSPATVQEIEEFGIQVTGIAGNRWKVIEGGSNSNGWKWYKGVRVVDDGQLIFGGYGVGPRGSYLLLVITTEAEYQASKADFDRWYDSLTVF